MGRKGLVMLLATLCMLASVSALTIPNSQIKTVEYFVGANGSQILNATARSYTFAISVPESNIAKRYAWIELSGMSTGTFDNNIDINLSNNMSDRFSLDSAGETQRYLIRYPYYPTLTNGTNTPYRLNVIVPGLGSPTSAECSKLILTYEYDSSSPRQIKTVKYFVGQNSSNVSSGTNIVFPFKIYIPETGSIIVKSAFIEIEGLSNGAADNAVVINTSGGPIMNYSIDSTIATQSYYLLYNASEIYGITTGGTYNYVANIRATGNPNTFVGARAVITYEYDSNSTNQLKTVRYFIGSNSSSIASNIPTRFTFGVPIAEPTIAVQSAFIKINGWTTAVQGHIQVNISGTNQINHTDSIKTEGNDFTLLYNATQLYSMTGATTNGPYTLNVRVAGPATTVLAAELFVTYNYSGNATQQTRTVEYGAFTDDVQRTAAIDVDRAFFLITPEQNITAKSIFMESSSITSATAAHTLTAGFGEVATLFSKGNTGETTFDYVVHNGSTRMYEITNGINGAFYTNKQDSAISSLTSGKVIATYFFQ